MARVAVAAPSPFPTYLQMTERAPLRVWIVLRALGLLATLGVLVALFVDAPTGLTLFWGVVVPLLPLVFFLAPGFWRNVCPMATLNQAPRVLGFSRALTLPKWFREYGYVVGVLLFLIIVPARRVVFDDNGPALALLIIASLGAAFVGGVVLKGKSGWCSTACPLLPVQRLYGQTPFLTVRNAHCRPCVGCVKNCYDFNPRVAYLADIFDADTHRSGYRKFFAAAFPGLILAFYTVASPPAISVVEMYVRFASIVLLSIGSFFVLEVFLRVTANKITALYAAAAFNLYYWFALPPLAALAGDALGVTAPSWLAWAVQTVLLALTAVWVARTYQKETPFVQQAVAPKPARVASGESLARLRATPAAAPAAPPPVPQRSAP